ncbi:hypothetical protein [Hoeflea sp.]|uniref:hypothetical protein n=1 Tax=Hoeflea sp. TaxID=1940281 RepID=UPI003B02B7C4
MPRIRFVMLSLIAAMMLAGCQTNSRDQVLASSESQVALRAIQTRAFHTPDKVRTMRSVIATLQDLGFVVDKADDVLGNVSATKLDGYQLRMDRDCPPERQEPDIGARIRPVQHHPDRGSAALQIFFCGAGKSDVPDSHQVD